MTRDALTSVFRNATSNHLATTPREGRREDAQTSSKLATMGSRAHEVLKPSTSLSSRFVFDNSTPRFPTPRASDQELTALRNTLEEDAMADRTRSARLGAEADALRAQTRKISLAQRDADAAFRRKETEEAIHKAHGEIAKSIETSTKQATERRLAALADAAAAEARRDALKSEVEHVAVSLDETKRALEAAKFMLKQFEACVDKREEPSIEREAVFETEVVSLEKQRQDRELEERFLVADKVAAEAVAALAAMSTKPQNDHAPCEETPVWPLSIPIESEDDSKALAERDAIEKRLLFAEKVAAEAVVTAALSAMRTAPSGTTFYTFDCGQAENVAMESGRKTPEAVAGPAGASLAPQHDDVALVEKLRQRESEFPIAKKTAYAGRHVSRLAARNGIVAESGDYAETAENNDVNTRVGTTTADGTEDNNETRHAFAEKDVNRIVQGKKPKTNLHRCRRFSRRCRGCSLGTIYGIQRIYSETKKQIRRRCRRRRREPLSRGVSLLLGAQIDDEVSLDGLRFLAPPHPCGDIPKAGRLEHELQSRLVVIMWIHALGAALIGSVGAIAFAAGLTWRPEIGSAIGGPLSLATLTVLKAATSMMLFAALFQRARIPQSLAVLGCGPHPRDMESGHLPFRRLSSQLLKRLMTAKIIDFSFGMILLAAFRSAFQRANQRNRGDAVRALLALTALGLFVVDVFGALHVWGVIVRFVHFLSKNTDDDAATESRESKQGLPHVEDNKKSVLQDVAAKRSKPFFVSPSMRWSDPSYAHEIETAALLSSHRDDVDVKAHGDFV